MDADVVGSSRDSSEGSFGEVKKPRAQLRDNWQPDREFSRVSPECKPRRYRTNLNVSLQFRTSKNTRNKMRLCFKRGNLASTQYRGSSE